MEEHGKTTRNFNQDSRTPGRDFNPEFSEHEAEATTNQIATFVGRNT
jgi:hypothetical protein